nr:choice-of-anchor E domain-containing protein [Niabella hibiscisoli]
MPVPAASISAFTGTGNVPILLRSLTGFSITGGGGNPVLKVGTTVSFELEVTYTYTSAPCQPVSGSVYLDKDGLANGINNQSKFTGAAAIGLKAVLVDADGIVVDVVSVDAAGNYSFPNIAPATGYTIRITTQSGIETGRSAPVPTLGTGADYVYAGELNGIGTGNDGNPDGISASFDMGAVPMTQINFAINSTAVLSADFADLFAKIKGGQLLVNFTTLEEANNDHFDVEVSNDGTSFKKIGEIKSKAINGTSKEVLHYDFNSEAQGSTLFFGAAILLISCGNMFRNRKHKTLLLAIFSIAFVGILAGCSKKSDSVSLQGTDVFVRIVQVDKDGTKTYSKVMKAINE